MGSEVYEEEAGSPIEPDESGLHRQQQQAQLRINRCALLRAPDHR